MQYLTMQEKLEQHPNADLTTVLAWQQAELAFRNEPTDANLRAMKAARLRVVANG